MIGRRFAIASFAAAIGLVPGDLQAQSCSLTSALDGSWAINISSRSLAYARTTTVHVTRAGRYLAGGISGGQTSVPEFDEVIPEVEGFAGLTIPLRGTLQLCARGGRFRWHGPSSLLLTQEYHRSHGSFWNVGALATISRSPRLEIVPSLSYSQRTVRTSSRFLPPASWQSPSISDTYTMSSVDVGLTVVVDDLAFAWIAMEREYGMPTGTRLGPLGRKNGENILTIGFGFTRRDRGNHPRQR